MKNFKYICIFLLFINFNSCVSNTSKKYVYKKNLMYTTFDLVIYSKMPKYKLNSYVDKIWDRISYLEKELSPAGDGFLGLLNKEGIIKKEINPEIFEIISNFIVLSKDVCVKSSGAFDLTVYPLIRLWGFYKQDEQYVVPSKEDIQNTLKHIGMQHIYITQNEIILSNQVQLDIGAIAKGYAVDQGISILTTIPEIESGFLNAGGNIRVFGQKPDSTPWKVGIRNPFGGSVQEVVSLYDGDSIATSGDYEQFFEVDGTYYHHIFNPKTGQPVTHNLASVSVVLQGSAEMADLLATTFLSLGKENTQKVIESFYKTNELALFFIERNQKELVSEANDLWIQRQNQ